MSLRRAFIGIAALACGCVTTQATRVVPGQSLDVSLAKLGGGSMSLASLKGKVVLVDVWASWCHPCAKAMPFYDDLQHALGAKGLVVVAIDVDEDERMAKAFVRDQNLGDLTILRDPGGQIVGPRFGISRLPTEFFLDRTGHVRIVHEGFSDADRAGFRRELEDLVAESAPAAH